MMDPLVDDAFQLATPGKKAKYPVAEPLYMPDSIYDDSVHDNIVISEIISQTQRER
jgi:hypothetical protein